MSRSYYEALIARITTENTGVDPKACEAARNIMLLDVSFHCYSCGIEESVLTIGGEIARIIQRDTK